MNTSLSRWAAFRLPLALFVGLLSLAAVLGLSRLGFEFHYRDAFRSPDPRYQKLQLLAESFGAGDSDCVVIFESDDMLSPAALEAVRRFQVQVGDLADVESVVSLYSARRPVRIGRMYPPLFPSPGSTEQRFTQARREAVEHPFLGSLLSKDHRAALAIVRVNAGLEAIADLERVQNQIRQSAADSVAGTSVSFGLTGTMPISVETVRRMQREQLLITAAGALLAIGVAWVLLRRLSAVVLVVVPAWIGALWTVGALGLAGKSMNAINIVLPPLVMVIGLADSIHILFHFLECRARGLSPSHAIRHALRDLAGACALTALTTSIGFLSLLAADDRIIGEFGIFGGLGVVLTFTAVMTVLPLLCLTPFGRWAVPPQHDARPEAARRGWAAALYAGLAPRALWLAPLLIVATILMVGQARRLQADFHFLENLTDASEAFRAMRKIEGQFGGGALLQVLVEWPQASAFYDPATVDVLTRVHEVLESNPATSAPVSLLSLLQSLPGPEGDLVARFSEFPYLPAEHLRSLLDEERRLALVTANVPDSGAAALREPLDELQRQLTQVEEQFPGYRLHLTGYSVVSAYRASSMIMNLKKGLSLEVLVIFVVIMVALRSPQLGLLSLPSNLFPLLATIVVIHAFGLPLRYSTVLSLSICLGVAVDDTIHFLSRFRRELALDGDYRGAIERSYRVMAPVMATSTLVMLSGFGAGLFCSIPTVRDFSTCACTALILALASELVVMPTMLLSLARLVEWRAARKANRGSRPDPVTVDVSAETVVPLN